jgi:hypothetical protein
MKKQGHSNFDCGFKYFRESTSVSDCQISKKTVANITINIFSRRHLSPCKPKQSRDDFNARHSSSTTHLCSSTTHLCSSTTHLWARLVH